MIWIYLAPYDGLLVPNEGMTHTDETVNVNVIIPFPFPR